MRWEGRDENLVMIFQGTAIPNLIIEVAGIMICLFALITIWYGSPRYTATKRFMTAAFGSMLAYNLCLLFLEFSQAAAGKDGQEYRWLSGILTVLAATGVLALLAAQLTGNLVLADEAGRFSYGAASSMGFVLTAMLMIIDLIMRLRLGQNISRRQRYAFISYLLLPLLSILVRSLWTGVYVVALASCISMVIMLIVVVDEQSKSLRKQELDNEQLKVDLMLSQIQPIQCCKQWIICI